MSPIELFWTAKKFWGKRCTSEFWNSLVHLLPFKNCVASSYKWFLYQNENMKTDSEKFRILIFAKIKWHENQKEQITTCNSKFFFVSLWYLYFLNPMSLKREAFKFSITELSTFSGASETRFGQYCLQLKRLPRSYCLPLESQKQPWRERQEEEVLPAGSSTNSVDQRVREQPG